MVKNYNNWSNSNLTKNIQFPTNHDEIEQILKQYNIKNYSIRSNGTIDVDGIVNLSSQTFEYFPIKFNMVKGEFWCFDCINLKSLEGAPKKCNIFNCNDCINLKSLRGSPEKCKCFNCKFSSDL